MKCNKCGAELLRSNFCPECGEDVGFYKLAAGKSNSYYNEGLAKARIHDLSGAIDSLKTSLLLDRKNIHARNLLGLCYYGMGEVIEALSEWVVSSYIRPEDNIAKEYIDEVQNDKSSFDMFTESIRKYNQALEYAREQSYDMAIIQLKNVVQKMPNYVKAQTLLALLYIQKKAYNRAAKCLEMALHIDKNNTEACYLKEELKKLRIQAKKAERNGTQTVTVQEMIVAEDDKVSDRPPLSGDDVIIPEKSSRLSNSGIFIVVNILIGVAIGAAIVFFLGMPARERSVASNYNTEIEDYSAKLSEANSKVEEANKQVSDITSQRDELQNQLNDIQGDGGINKYAVALLDAASKYINNDKSGCAASLTQISSEDQLPNDTAKSLYKLLSDNTTAEQAQAYKSSGITAYNAQNYQEAARLLEKAYEINKDEETCYYCAKSYDALGDSDSARTYFMTIVNVYSTGQYNSEAENYIYSH